MTEKEKEIKLNDNERQRCSIYSRVMGYHAEISFWNAGKQSEFKDRKYFKEPKL